MSPSSRATTAPVEGSGESRTARVMAAFRQHLARLPASEELRTLVASKGDPERAVLASEEYLRRVENRLSPQFTALLARAPSAADASAFVEYCNADHDREPELPKTSLPAEVTSAQVRAYVARLPEFERLWAPALDAALKKCGLAEPTTTERAKLAALVAQSRTPRPGDSELADLAQKVRRADGSPPQSAPPEPPASGDEIAAPNTPQTAFVRAWRAATGRHIDVYEFLRYFQELGPSASQADLLGAVARQDRFYAVAAAVARDYRGAELTRVEFLEQHHAHFDAPGFAEALVSAAVASAEYRALMVSAVESAFRSAFDSDVEPEDADHAFAALRAARAPLPGDAVPLAAAELGRELARARDIAAAAFGRVLRRKPDAIEQRDALRLLRRHAAGTEPPPKTAAQEGDAPAPLLPYEAAAIAELEDRLYNSLEYIDVLRLKVEAARSTADRARVYRELDRVVQECRGDMRAAEAVIATGTHK